jgi:hypothetical protein
MADANSHLDFATRIWRNLTAVAHRLGCGGDPNDVDDTHLDSAVLRILLKHSEKFDVVGVNMLDNNKSLSGFWDADDPRHLWSPLAISLMRLCNDIPPEVGAGQALNRGRVERGGYIVYSPPTNGKTHTAMWLIKKYKRLPEHKRPKGFMVTGAGRRNEEDYASFLARSLKIDGNIEPATFAKLLADSLFFWKLREEAPIDTDPR